jgi:hypothetical protein
MNYIRELNAFRDWLILNDLATSEVALWYTLMSVNNMTGWREWFTVPNSTLQQLAKLSKQGLDNARSALKGKGLIDYRKGSRKQAGSYKITSLVNSFDQSLDPKLDQSSYQSLDQSVDQLDDQRLPIIKHKLNETKLSEIDIGEIRDRLRKLTIECGLKGVGIDGLETIYTYIGQVETEVIEKAIKKAEKKHVPYFVTIINDWIDEGKTTMDSFSPPTPNRGGDRDGKQGASASEASSTDPRPDSLSSRFTKTE